MRWLLTILLAFPLSLLAADGDIVGAAVETNGWTLDVWIAGNSGSYTNGTFAFGLGTNGMIVGTEKVTVTLTSAGYNDDGTTNQTLRTLYGTRQIRFPYPDDAYTDSTIDGSNIKIKISLSDFVYAPDISATVNIGSGLYATNTLTSAAATGQTVTNNSLQPYPKVIGNWSWPPFQLINSSPMSLRAVAFHGSASQGKPVQTVRFSVSDGTHSAETFVTRMTIDHTMSDREPFGEYVGNLNVAGFTQGALITCNFTAWPRIGDTNSVLDTSTAGFTWPTPNPAPLTNICNLSATYGITRAIVDPATTDDTTGIAANEIYWATNSSPSPFKTIGGALTKIAATNNASYSRNEIGGGYVYLTAANHAWLGSSLTLANTASTWCNIEPAPGTAAWSCVITGYSTDYIGKTDGDKYHIRNIKYDVPSGGTHAYAHLWHDSCFIAANTGTFIRATGANEWYLTSCIISNLLQGIKPYTTDPLAPALVRGNLFDNFDSILLVYTALGNAAIPTASANNMTVVCDLGSAGVPVATHGVLYNNWFSKLRNVGALLTGPTSYTLTNGLVLAQNTFEEITNVQTSASYNICGQSTLAYTNLLLWHNDFLGARSFVGYNESGTSPAWRYLWSEKGNIYDDYNIKTDVFAPGADGARIGNWPLIWGAGFEHYIDLATTGIGAGNSFYNSDPSNRGYSGRNSLEYYGIAGATSSTNYPAFVDRKAYDGVATTAGGGNYCLQTKSPLHTLFHPEVRPSDWQLPFDLGGLPRGNSDPPGAYASGNPRKGAGFF